MIYKDVFSIDQKTFDVLDLRFSFSQPPEGEGGPAKKPSRIIKLRIDSSCKESEIFIPWVQDVFIRKNGEITYMPNEEQDLVKTSDFTKKDAVWHTGKTLRQEIPVR